MYLTGAEDDSALHDEHHALQRADVLQRIACDGDEVRFVTRRDGAGTIAESKRLGGEPRGNALLPVSPATQFDNVTNVKTFAAKDTDQVAVILINQDGSTDFSYAVSLNGSASGGTLQVNIPANITATQSTGTLYKQSTLLLVFDSSGTLKKKVEYRRYGPSGTPWINTTTY